MPSRRGLVLWALAVVLATAVVVAAGSWLVMTRYGPALTRERVERALAEALDRPVRVERVVLRPWLLRADVEGLGVAAGPTWEAGTVLRAGRASVGLSVASLWRLRAVLDLDVRDVDVAATAGPGGAGLALPERIPDRFEVGPVTILVGRLGLERAHARYVDRDAGLTLDTHIAGARVRPAGGGLDVTLDVDAVRVTTPEVDESVTALRVAAGLRGRTLTLERLRARWRDEGIEVTGRVRELDARRLLELAVRGRVPLGAVSALARVEPPVTGTLAFDASVEGPADAPRVTGRATVPELTAGAVTARRVAADVQWGDGTLRLSKITAQALGGSVSGAVTVTPARPGASEVTARLDRVALAALERLAGRPLGVGGHVSATGELRGDLRDLAGAAGAVRVESGDLTLPEPLARLGPGTVSAEARLDAGAVEIVRARARWSSVEASDVSGGLTREGPRRLHATLVAQLAPLARAWGQDGVAGRARVVTTLDGRWDDLAARGRVHAAPLRAPGIAVDTVDATFALSGRTLALSSAAIALKQSRLEGAATLAWSGPLDAARWREAVRLEATFAAPEARVEDLAAWLPPAWRGHGRFTVTAGRVSGTSAAWTAGGRVASEALVVRGEPVTRLVARVAADPARVEVTGVEATLRGIPVTGGGAWQWASGSGRARLDAGPAPLGAVPGLAGRAPLDGRLRASAELAFDARGVSGTATATATDVAVAGVALGRGRLEAELARSVLAARLAFPAAGVSATAAGTLADGEELSVRVELADVDLAPVLARLTVPAAAGEVSGRVSGGAALAVPYSAPAAARGTLNLDPVRLRVAGEEWRNAGPVLVRRQSGRTRLQAARLESGVGTLSATGVVEDGGALDLAVRVHTSLGILPALHAQIREAGGALDATATITGTTSAPRLQGGGTLANGRLVLQALGEPLTALRGRFTFDGTRARVAEAVATLSGGEVRASGDVDFAGAAPSLDVKLRGRFPLSVLATLRPEIQEAAGALDVDATVSGTTAAPQAVGDGTIRDGLLRLSAHPEALRDIQAQFTMSPAGVRLSSATAAFGGGEVSARGDLALKERALGPFRFDVEARSVSLQPAPGVRTTWDADLELLGGESRTLLRGEARLQRGTYVSDEPLLQLLLARRGGGAGAEPGLALPLQIRVRLDDNLSVRTTVARFRAGGAVTLQGTTAAPVLFGTVVVREGQLIFRKQRFTLTSAAARFTDPRRIDPILDVQGQARIRAYDVTLRMTGRGEDLQIRLSSTPSLPEEDILALIAFGSTREQLARGGATAVAGEMAGLVLRDLFGFSGGEGDGPFDVLELETTEEGDRNVRVGTRLNDKTRVLYSQGLERSDARRLRLEYELIGPLVIAGEQDFQGGFGGDVLLRLRFR